MPCVKVGKENSSPVDIHYEDVGCGRLVVLVHGFPLSGRSWEADPVAVGRVPGMRVLAGQLGTVIVPV
jgi:non-heme chloroperoxidase